MRAWLKFTRTHYVCLVLQTLLGLSSSIAALQRLVEFTVNLFNVLHCCSKFISEKGGREGNLYIEMHGPTIGLLYRDAIGQMELIFSVFPGNIKNF